MIIGHYAAGFVASRLEPRLPLWHAMIAVVWLDILHSTLVLLGIEQAAVVPGITAVVPIDLIYYPFSHSLLASFIWSGLAYALYARRSRRVGLYAAMCVFSHFVLDLVTHRPDLPLLSGEPKLGLGLWQSIAGTFVVENLLLFASLVLYTRQGSQPKERYATAAMCVAGSAMFFTFPYSEFPADIRYTEAFALFIYVLVPVVAYAVRRSTSPASEARAARIETQPAPSAPNID